jgi:hypothetical protein
MTIHTYNNKCNNCVSYKFGDNSNRSITVSHTDPGGRDRNGFMTGSYYVGVYGYCYDVKYVRDNYDLPCTNYDYDIDFNLTVQFLQRLIYLLFYFYCVQCF